MFDYAAYKTALPAMKRDYQAAEIFPHIIMDNFADAAVLGPAADDFPPIKGEAWIHYKHFNENKGGLNKRHAIPPRLLALIDEMNSPQFVAWLSELTGIPGLMPETDIEGGGLHQIQPGGFLNIHADFTVHPHHKMWQRRVNLLLYLNRGWEDRYGGALEFWTKDMQRSFKETLPVFNRCVIFNTEADSYHGHPKPLTCPRDMTRKSIALYYYTEEKKAPRRTATNYRARPGDGSKGIFIYLDKKVLATYNWLKSTFGISDAFASKMLRFFARLRDKKE